MSELHKLRQAWGAALGVCEFFGWPPEQLQDGLPVLDSEFQWGEDTKRGYMERRSVELANLIRQELNRLEEDAFWKRGHE